LVILKDDDIVEWGEFPPSNGEEYAESELFIYYNEHQILYSTHNA